jgi:hypothetical protein
LAQRSHPPAGREEFLADARGIEEIGLRAAVEAGVDDAEAQRLARTTLRSQITRLETEISTIVAERFPYLSVRGEPAARRGGPRLPDLGELERCRDDLAGHLQRLRARAARRSQHERAARELLEQMLLEPGRYKYYRVPLRDLGQPGCGVYESRPKLGVIGMLAGWWEVKLSSGCPLARGSGSYPRPRSPQKAPANAGGFAGVVRPPQAGWQRFWQCAAGLKAAEGARPAAIPLWDYDLAGCPADDSTGVV